MSIAFRSISTAVTVTSGGITLNEPAGAQAGDLLIADIAFRGNAAFSLPSGGEWSLCAQENSGNTSTTTNASIGSGLKAYCIRGASAPNLTFGRTGGDVAFGRVRAYQNVDPTSPFVGAQAVTRASNGTGQSVSAINTDEDGCLIDIGFYGADNTTCGSYAAATDPTSGWSERGDSNTSSGADTTLAVADAIQAAAGSTGTLSCTAGNSSRHVMIAAAFRPDPNYVPPLAEFMDYGWAENDASSYNFTSMPLGAADAGRYMVAFFVWREGSAAVRSVSSCTIGGVSASQLAATPGGHGQIGMAAWGAVVPTGTTGTVAVTFNASNSRCALALFRLEGADYSAMVDSPGVFLDGQFDGDDPVSVTIDTESGGAVIAFGGAVVNPPSGWQSGVDGVGADEIESVISFEAGLFNVESGEANRSIVYTQDGGNCSAIIALSFAPAALAARPRFSASLVC